MSCVACFNIKQVGKALKEVGKNTAINCWLQPIGTNVNDIFGASSTENAAPARQRRGVTDAPSLYEPEAKFIFRD